MTYDQKTQVGKFEIQIDSKEQYGFFEHDDYGDELGGGLWFKNNELIDYDGLCCLPKEVSKGVEELGYTVDETFKD